MSRSMHVWALVLVAAAFGGDLRPARAAEERDRAVEFYEAKQPAIAKFAAKVLWRAAKAARDDELHWQCVDLCNRILAWDTDHRSAREHLGWVRKKGRWVQDADAVAAVIRSNTRRSGETVEKYRERRAAWERKYRDPALAEIAERLARVGRDCARKGYDLQARRAFERALAFDTDQVQARAGLGFVRVGEHWLAARYAGVLESCRDLAPAEPEDAWEKVLGITLTGARAKHVQVVETSERGWIDYVTRSGELAWAVGMDILGRDPKEDPFAAKRARFVMVDEPRWKRWSRRYRYKGDSDSEAEERNSVGNRLGPWFARKRREWSGRVDDADFVAHVVAESLLFRAWKESRPDWVWEGFGQMVAARVVPVSDVRCVGEASSRYGSQQTEDRFAGSPRWRLLMREVVASGDELPLRTLMGRGLTGMPLEHGIQCWSMLSWLHEHHRDGFREFIAAASKKSDQPALLQQYIGLTPEQVDEAWRAYVLRNY